MKYAIFFAACIAGVMAIASCNRIEEKAEPVRETTILEVSLTPATGKTALGASVDGKRKVYWSDGDQLSVNGTASDPLQDVGAEAASASFVFTGTLTAPFNILYPASFYKDDTTITLPETQEFTEGSFAPGAAPLAGYKESASDPSAINHLCTYIQLSVKKDPAVSASSLTTVTFSGNDGEQVCGDFTIDYIVPSITGSASGAGKTLTLNVDQPLNENNALDLFLVVPARSYQNGFTITLEDDQHRVMAKSKGSATTLTAGRVVKMTAFFFVPSPVTTELTLEDVIEEVLPFDYNVTGQVFDDSGNPLEGVVVSDGLQCVKTMFDGSFYMESDPSTAKFIFVSTPSGYMPLVSGGIPRFYKALSDIMPSGGIYDCGSFVLAPVANPERYTLLITADPQPRANNWNLDNVAFRALDVCEDLYDELYDVAHGITDRQVYGICLGDLVHENMSLFSNYATGLARVGFPTYNVIGNHDNDPSAANDDAAGAPFESYFGPRNYSFNIGKLHFVVLDNLMMKKDPDNDNKLTAFDQGLTDRIWAWLQADLAYIPTSTKLMVCAHSPMFKQSSGSERTNTALHGADYGDLINNYTEIHAWAGHTHTSFNYIYPSSHRHRRVQVHTLARSTGELWTNEYLAEGTPRGFTIVEVDGNDITWRFHPTKYQKAAFIGVSSGYTTSEPFYQWRDWNYSSGKAYMKNGGQLLDETYQLHAYPPGTYDDEYIYANVFLWDSKWDVPVYTPMGGTPVAMTQINTADNHTLFSDWDKIYDYADTEFRTHYKTNSSLMHAYSGYKVSGVGDGADKAPEITTLFRVPVSGAHGSGMVSVKDRFGNTYSRPVSW